jgi:hypothetical protein
LAASVKFAPLHFHFRSAIAIPAPQP